MENHSPMMKQYLQIKDNNRDSIVFFRLGDFYEMFYDDAKLASKELDLTLTGRDCGTEERAPMCGVPYHSSEAYIARLIAKGYKVAICEQTEEAGSGKKLVNREIVRVVTPGTVIEDTMLDEDKNNYICGIYLAEEASVCFIDISTGGAYATKLTGGNLEGKIFSELSKFSPREAVISESLAKNDAFCKKLREEFSVSVESLPDEAFSEESAILALSEHFKTSELSKVGFNGERAIISAAGGLISYLANTQKNDLSHINAVSIYSEKQFMVLDATAKRNLEICETLREKEKRGSLLWALDKTKTAMGSRLLRSWVEKPLLDTHEINNRLSAVEELFGDAIAREELAESLKSVRDIERLLGRVVYGIANGRDLKAMSKTFLELPNIKGKISAFSSPLLTSLYGDLDELCDVCRAIEDAISEEAPFSIREGGIIKEGYSAEVDELRDIMKNGKGYIANIAAKEKEETGIKNLKIGYNRVFGYYIEVSKSNIDSVPERYIRKQTLTNGERYITDELKDLEATILGAQEKLCRLETEIFKGVCALVGENVERIRKTASALSSVDVITCFASLAARYGYTKPKVTSGERIVIKDGRHPVVERVLKDSLFVPNDTTLDCGDNRMAIITGPNMAGKSTYMRQVALITLMAQIGSFVPAKSAEIGVVDRIFTRIGASDDLASGRSTFMVEMSEVSEIIKNATSKSLIILDEIGRGTSTFDGMSIARAVIEYVADKKYIGAKTLFATHYHELTSLEGELSGVKNYNIAVKKHGFDITFLRKIVRGGADDSYGIEVARLAGIPDSLTLRAKEILSGLENSESIPKAEFEVSPERERSREAGEIISRLAHMDVNTLSPLEALSILFELSRKARDAE